MVGIPYDPSPSRAVLPIAHTIGTDFKPAKREPLDKILHWDQW